MKNNYSIYLLSLLLLILPLSSYGQAWIGNINNPPPSSSWINTGNYPNLPVQIEQREMNQDDKEDDVQQQQYYEKDMITPSDHDHCDKSVVIYARSVAEFEEKESDWIEDNYLNDRHPTFNRYKSTQCVLYFPSVNKNFSFYSNKIILKNEYGSYELVYFLLYLTK
jgi:hypothetical protein